MSVTRKNIYEYACDKAGCKERRRADKRETPDGWAGLVMGEVKMHFCGKCAAKTWGEGE